VYKQIIKQFTEVWDVLVVVRLFVGIFLI